MSKIQSLESQEYRKRIMENLSKLKDKSRDGFWKLKSKLFPEKQPKDPMVKKCKRSTNHKSYGIKATIPQSFQV